MTYVIFSMKCFKMVDELMNLSEELKNIRKQRKWSQSDLAREIGVSFATVNRWETGKTQPSKLAYEKIIKIIKRDKHNVL